MEEEVREAASRAVDAWESAEGESMRDGFRQTMERCIANEIKAARQSVARRCAEIAREMAERHQGIASTAYRERVDDAVTWWRQIAAFDYDIRDAIRAEFNLPAQGGEEGD
jgi:hypothetical protein